MNHCIGFQLPDFSLSDLSISKEFTKPVYFSGSQFFGEVYFSGPEFKGGASFYEANFQAQV
jgi:Pentapeptide repeats (9 copies)